SNTATTVLMLPIATSVAALVTERIGGADGSDHGASRDAERFGIALLLGVAYAASIGGIGTLIGTPPNVFLAAHLKNDYGIEIGFARWMGAALPFVIVFLALAWLVLAHGLFRVSFREVPGGRRLIQGELAKLGPPSRGEKSVLAVFLFTAMLWVFREPLESWDAFTRVLSGFPRLGDPGIALVGAFLLFLIPVDVRKRRFLLDWETAARLPWGVLLLFGGGLSLAAAVDESGLAAWVSRRFPSDLPIFGLMALVTVAVVFFTELTSNIATTTVFVPILGSIAVASGSDPRLLVIPAALSASCAFMLPVATPPNAIVFGSGLVPIRTMIAAGFWLNLIAIGLIVLSLRTLFGAVLGIEG
ncbi:MAG TPA: DASS family sodium-coupled anion symporter, partial [Planctomycetota bacterium]|nr:DASS family sodium-coupled anion symporter [Planctomycetota bacterium]